MDDAFLGRHGPAILSVDIAHGYRITGCESFDFLLVTSIDYFQWSEGHGD